MTRVINIKQKQGLNFEVYIGRPSIFGNPIVVGKVCTICGNVHDRGETLVCYRVYLMHRLEHDMKFKQAVRELKGKTLICFCKPLPCHGDILAEIAETL